jgi:hypothetical protein
MLKLKLFHLDLVQNMSSIPSYLLVSAKYIFHGFNSYLGFGHTAEILMAVAGFPEATRRNIFFLGRG